MNTFSKERIFACCKFISEYLQTIEFNIQDEELFSKLLDDLKLEGFGNIDFSEDEAEKLEDGSIHLKNDFEAFMEKELRPYLSEGVV